MGPDLGPDLRARTWDPTLGPRALGPDLGPDLRAWTWDPTLGPRALGPELGPDLRARDQGTQGPGARHYECTN